jgi:hypothetical protein
MARMIAPQYAMCQSYRRTRLLDAVRRGFRVRIPCKSDPTRVSHAWRQVPWRFVAAKW